MRPCRPWAQQAYVRGECRVRMFTFVHNPTAIASRSSGSRGWPRHRA